MEYRPQKIEKKWQRFWEKQGLFRARDFSKKQKTYILVEFPYPSGEGLHVGHCRPYVALDIISRKRRMEGFNTLFPMGWDAFGLPTENYAVKTGIHPRIVTRKNTAFFKRQQKSLGLSFDWSREIATTDPSYYKWTQWIFLELFKHGLAYKAKVPINWCPSCKISLANEEVIDGKCERCGETVARVEKEQWILGITKYAERLIEDLNLVDYPEKVVILQKEWIGKSEGVEIKFPLSHSSLSIDVFTTRLDTIFGATYLVLAPEHPILEKLNSQIKNLKSLNSYIERAKIKLERERISEVKEKTGVKLEGVSVLNPVNKKEIPIFVADYILPHYGTGGVMAVPCHDKRDFEFSKKYNLPMIEVIKPKNEEKKLDFQLSGGSYGEAFTGEGVLINSGRFNGLNSKIARERIREWLKREGLARKAVHYKLRDWIFSRQRYWGEPIPLVFCENCAVQINADINADKRGYISVNQRNNQRKSAFSEGELLNPGWIAVSEKDLPVKLPQVKDYKPSEKGESPLATVKSWLNTKCPKCGSLAKRETDVMPNWAGSNWYFLRYCDPENEKRLASPKLLRYWMPVDWYNGGMEHTTLHLLYSRFIYKFLWDIGAVPKSLGPEPYKKRTSHGIILAEGGVKMSKSKGNVINPDNVIKQFGADTLRVYEMFMGPFSQAITWDTKGVKGVRRFLDKIWKLSDEFINVNQRRNQRSTSGLKKLLHKTIKKVSEDIENLKFNTAVSALMEFSNSWQKERIGKKEFKDFLKVFSVFAPHLAEELWSRLTNISVNQRLAQRKSASIFNEKWPKYDLKLIKEEKVTLIVQINGRVRDKIEVKKGILESQANKTALEREKIKKWIKNKEIKKIVFVRDKLINFVIDFV